MKYFIILFIFLSFCNYSCKKNFVNKKVAEKENTSNLEINPIFKFESWNLKNNSNEIYKFQDKSLQLKSFLDETKNEGGKKLYLNDQEIDFIITDAYVFTPYIFVNGNQSIILIQEEDEGSIYGYIAYYFKKNDLINKAYLDIAPINDVAINQFVQFEDKGNFINVSILAEKYYNTKNDSIENSDQYHFKISKKPLSTINDPKENEIENEEEIMGLWQKDCKINNSGIDIYLNQNKVYGTLALAPPAIFLEVLIEKGNEKNAYNVKFVSQDMTPPLANENTIDEKNISKQENIGKIVLNNKEMDFYWYGLLNLNTNNRTHLKTQFSNDGTPNFVQFKKCTNDEN